MERKIARATDDGSRYRREVLYVGVLAVFGRSAMQVRPFARSGEQGVSRVRATQPKSQRLMRGDPMRDARVIGRKVTL